MCCHELPDITSRDFLFFNNCKGFLSSLPNDIATLHAICAATHTSRPHPTRPVDIARITHFFPQQQQVTQVIPSPEKNFKKF